MFPYRDMLGQIAHTAWWQFCQERVTKPNMNDWQTMEEWDKEAFRQMGEAVAQAMIERAQHNIQLHINYLRQMAGNLAMTADYQRESKLIGQAADLEIVKGRLAD